MPKLNNKVVTDRMETRTTKRSAQRKKELTPEQEKFVNEADVIVNNNEEPKKGRGRPASSVKKRKVTFDMAEDLIAEIDNVAKFYGMNRAQFVSQAVMKAVREAQRTENL